MKLKGIYVVMVTPFQRDEAVDFGALGSNVDWYIEQGVHGLVACGSTGEFAAMTPGERMRVAEAVIERANGRVPVVVGTTAETTAGVLELQRHALSAGAAAAMLLPPPYFKPSQAEAVDHVRTIALSVELPIMLYNNPGTSGVDMGLDTILSLADLDMVQYVKESSGEIERVRDIVRRGRGRISVFCGWESLAYESFLMGADGWVCVLANIVPRMCCDLYGAAERRDCAGAMKLYERMLPLLIHLESCGQLVQVTKAAMARLGRPGGECRRPRLPLTPTDEAELDRLLRELTLQADTA